MIEQNENSQSKLKYSRNKSRFKSPVKASPYEINIQNYLSNHDFSLQRIDPKGIQSNAIYASFSGVIENADIYTDEDVLQAQYKIVSGSQWHDQTPEVHDTQGHSAFCQVRDKKMAFSVGFECLLSCAYIASWPQIVLTFKGFNKIGEIQTIGYAHTYLPSQPGKQYVLEAYIYSIVKNQKWYHKWFPIFDSPIGSFQEKDFERIIVKGEGRQMQKIKTIGKVRIRAQLLLRNFTKFGYR